MAIALPTLEEIREAMRQELRAAVEELRAATPVAAPAAAPTAPDDLLTPDDVAQRAGVCVDTVWRWIKRGLRATRVPGGREYRIRRADFDLWMSRAPTTPPKKGAPRRR